ncbi:MAG: DUF883 family protein [Phycisphaerales bacterium]|nr:DUF883 family protein [Phycisphaerales bacterium]MCB9863134.1 DUF883 family protein [Phycisphaerales bacterium]
MATNNTSKSNRNNTRASDTQVGVDDIREQAVAVGEDVRDLARNAGQMALDQMDPIEEYIRTKPVKSVLIAAGVGALLGAMFLRR